MVSKHVYFHNLLRFMLNVQVTSPTLIFNHFLSSSQTLQLSSINILRDKHGASSIRLTVNQADVLIVTYIHFPWTG